MLNVALAEIPASLRTNRVECGDSLYLLSRLPDRSIGAIVTDPPFFCGISRDDGGIGSDPWAKDVTSTDSAIAWCKPYAEQFFRVTRRGGAVTVMGGAHACAAWMRTMEAAGFIWMAELTVLWNTGKPRQSNFGSLTTHVLWFSSPGVRHTWNTKRRAIYSNVLVCDKVHISHRHHPAQKPVELTTFLVSLLTKSDDIVLDPFCGSGSTLVSAAIAGRPYIGFDRDRDSVNEARRRARNWDVEEEKELRLWVNGKLEEI